MVWVLRASVCTCTGWALHNSQEYLSHQDISESCLQMAVTDLKREVLFGRKTSLGVPLWGPPSSSLCSCRSPAWFPWQRQHRSPYLPTPVRLFLLPKNRALSSARAQTLQPHPFPSLPRGLCTPPWFPFFHISLNAREIDQDADSGLFCPHPSFRAGWSSVITTLEYYREPAQCLPCRAWHFSEWFLLFFFSQGYERQCCAGHRVWNRCGIRIEPRLEQAPPFLLVAP